MGFVAAAALSFCFPDFIVFRFTQAAIWAIALVGLVILCGVSGQFSFAQAGLFGIGGYAAAILGSHTALSVYCGAAAGAAGGLRRGLWAGPRRRRPQPVDPGAGDLRLRHRLPAASALAADRTLDRRRAGPLSRLSHAARGLPQQRPLGLPDGADAAGSRPVAGAQPDRQPLRPRPAGGARRRSRGGGAGHSRRAGAGHGVGHRRRLPGAGRLPVGLPVRLRRPDRLQLRALGADAVRPGDRRHAFARPAPSWAACSCSSSPTSPPASARACRPCSMPCC